MVYVLGLIGGVGGTITMAAYGYWAIAKGWRGTGWLSVMRLDNAVGYVMTGVFVVAMLVIGAEILLGQDLASGDTGLLTLGTELGARYGEWARVLFLVGFLGFIFGSLVIWIDDPGAQSEDRALLHAAQVISIQETDAELHDLPVGSRLGPPRGRIGADHRQPAARCSGNVVRTRMRQFVVAVTHFHP